MGTYRLIAYQYGGDQVVLDWPNVAATCRFHKGDVMVDADTKWEIVGVRNSSTEQLWLIDVVKASES